MAHISESKVDGVVYTYDSESRNPLGLDAKMRMWAGTLVYDKNTRAPTRILKGDIPTPTPTPTPVVTVAKPTISITSDGKVTITCATAGAVIYYTTNGSNPSDSSTEYAGQFTLADSATVKAIAYAEIDGEEKVSGVASKAYTKQSTPTPPPSSSGHVYLGFIYSPEDADDLSSFEEYLDMITEDVILNRAPTGGSSNPAMNQVEDLGEFTATSVLKKFTQLSDGGNGNYFSTGLFAYPSSFGTIKLKDSMGNEYPRYTKELTVNGVAYTVVVGMGDGSNFEFIAFK